MKNNILKYLFKDLKVGKYLLLQIVMLMLFIIINNLKMHPEFKLLIDIIMIFIIIYITYNICRKSIVIGVKNLTEEEKIKELEKRIKNDEVLNKGPKVVIIGGGTGLGNILKGLKEHTNNITAIVTTFDDGSSTGKLKKEFDVLAPGDIRQCLTSLSTSENSMEKLLSYRFKDGHLDNHALGNLILVAMADIMGSFPAGIEQLSNIFSVTGTVLPVTLDKTILCAKYDDGTIAMGEDSIPRKGINKRIKEIYLKDKAINPAPKVIESIKDADIIILGPGSLYCSVICNLLVNDISEAIINSKAKKVYISNIMTQYGETDNYTLSDHVNEVEKYLGKNVLDYVFANETVITESMMDEFKQINSKPVIIDEDKIINKNLKIIKDDYIITKPSKIMHNSNKIAKDIINLVNSNDKGEINE